MFDDGVSKNTDNPASYNYTNKLLWSSDIKSNVTSLGETRTGLFAFNDSIKNSIKYMYLNNNSFSDVNSLIDFKSIVELQLQCNSNLSSIEGLKNHGNLEILTLHNCSLINLVDFSSEDLENKTKVSKLSKLTLQGNASLESLSGIDDSKEIIYLIANNCNLTDIDSLKNHSQVTYLDLANNVHLQSVRYIQHCKALKYIYLDNNVEMINNELNLALNGTSEDKEFGQDILIKNCINGYQNIPRKYWELFEGTATILDYSYGTLNEYLTTDSPKWLNLKGRTDITKLKLDGQIKLPMKDEIKDGVKYSGIETVLSDLTGMKALSLYNCSQLNSLDFVKKMGGLCEIDLRGISKELQDYSSLNSCNKLFKLMIDNPNIDLKKIVTTLNNMSENSWDSKYSWAGKYSYPGIGLYDKGPWIFYDESDENRLLKFSYCLVSPAYQGDVSVDLSHTSCTWVKGYAYDDFTTNIVLPKKVTFISADCSRNSYLDFSTVEDKTEITQLLYGHDSDNFLKKTLSSTSHVVIKKLTLWCEAEFSLDDFDFNSVKELSLSKSGMDIKANVWNLKCFENNNFTEKISLTDTSAKRFENIILNLDSFGKNKSIKEITFTGLGINSLDWIKNMTQVLSLNLNDNRISNITGLSKLEKLQNLSLSKNSISDITPLVEAIGEDGVINYKSLDISYNSLDGSTVADNVGALLKLHRAGLQKVTITGNNFTSNEIQDLINGKTIDGEVYVGFGEGNVIN